MDADLKVHDVVAVTCNGGIWWMREQYDQRISGWQELLGVCIVASNDGFDVGDECAFAFERMPGDNLQFLCNVDRPPDPDAARAMAALLC